AITERLRLRAEGTFTNILNHANLADPYTNLGSSNLGIVSSSIKSDFGGARTGQISVRADF
ncbi:MAG TPA: hypothetical protein VGL00_11620, partial [Terracidiphilus sp.]